MSNHMSYDISTLYHIISTYLIKLHHIVSRFIFDHVISSQGIQLFVWESPRVLRLEALMRVDGGDSGSRDNSYSHNMQLIFTSPANISDISELVPGIGAATTLVSELQSYSCDDSKFVTLGIHLHLPQDIHSKSRRIVVIMLASRDDRNEVLQSLRSLAQDVRLGGNELQ
eukprot:gene36144-46993_t